MHSLTRNTTRKGPRRPTICPIDSPHEGIHLVREILILLDVLATRNGHLDQGDLVAELRVLLQEAPVSLQFLHQPFRVVQSVDANDNRLALVLFFEGLDPLLHTWIES